MTRPPKKPDADAEKPKPPARRRAKAAPRAKSAATPASDTPAKAKPAAARARAATGAAARKRAARTAAKAEPAPPPAPAQPQAVAEPAPKPAAMGDAYPQPVFILAAPRSFTSLVTAMIGQHPELYGVPELNLFQCETIEEFNTGRGADGKKKSPFWTAMRHGLLRCVAELYSGEQTVHTVAMAERWLKSRETMTSAEVFQEIAKKVAPYRIVEKSPGVLRKMEFLDRQFAAFPGGRFIHLVRNPLSQCNSVLKAKGGIGVLLALNSVDQRGKKAAIEPQIMWHDTQVQILRFLDKVPEDQFVTIRGEEFLSNLNESLPALCRWLGIDDGPEAVAAMKRPQDSAYSCIGPSNAPLGNDVNFLNAPELREGNVKSPSLDTPLPWREDGDQFHPRLKALAQDLGY